MAISMLKIRRPLGRLIFNMGIAIPGKTVFLIETAPRISSKIMENLIEFDHLIFVDKLTWLILGLRPANERRRYKVTRSLIGWAQT